jgi:hypothetical protein
MAKRFGRFLSAFLTEESGWHGWQRWQRWHWWNSARSQRNLKILFGNDFWISLYWAGFMGWISDEAGYLFFQKSWAKREKEI